MRDPGGLSGLFCIAVIAIPIGFAIGVAISAMMLRAAAWLIGGEGLDQTTAVTTVVFMMLAHIFVVGAMAATGSLSGPLHLGQMMVLLTAYILVDAGVVMVWLGSSFGEALALILALNFLLSPLNLLLFTASLR